ncbi:MAG: hypothetical protein AAGJ31_16220, partial [Verrucomicrobiota bacterium]
VEERGLERLTGVLVYPSLVEWHNAFAVGSEPHGRWHYGCRLEGLQFLGSRGRRWGGGSLGIPKDWHPLS